MLAEQLFAAVLFAGFHNIANIVAQVSEQAAFESADFSGDLMVTHVRFWPWCYRREGAWLSINPAPQIQNAAIAGD